MLVEWAEGLGFSLQAGMIILGSQLSLRTSEVFKRRQLPFPLQG